MSFLQNIANLPHSVAFQKTVTFIIIITVMTPNLTARSFP